MGNEHGKEKNAQGHLGDLGYAPEAKADASSGVRDASVRLPRLLGGQAQILLEVAAASVRSHLVIPGVGGRMEDAKDVGAHQTIPEIHEAVTGCEAASETARVG